MYVYKASITSYCVYSTALLRPFSMLLRVTTLELHTAVNNDMSSHSPVVVDGSVGLVAFGASVCERHGSLKKYHLGQLGHYIPYSRKFPREKIFTNFMDRLPFANIFPANILLYYIAYRLRAKLRTQNFFHENANFKNFAKISPTKISRYMVSRY